MRSLLMSKKGQISLGDAPTVVMIVGFVFLIMATIAYVGVKFGDATDTSTTNSVVNETVLGFNVSVGDDLSVSNFKNVVCTITTVKNATTGEDIGAVNWTATNCNLKAVTPADQENSNVKVDYTYTFDLNSVASNVTDDLQTEISNNTSIAGIVLTISLVGIVLAVLIGIFLASRRGGM